MQFLNGQEPGYDLTYNDVFLVPNYSTIDSRFEINIEPLDKSGVTLPVVVANMNAVAGKRMSETVARRGGLTILPQDMPFDELAGTVKYIKSRHTLYETPLTLSPDNTILDALNLINKRAHATIVIVDKANQPLGIFTEADAEGYDRFTPLSAIMSKELVTIKNGLTPSKIFTALHQKHVSTAPVVENGKMVGIVTQKGIMRSSLYKPAVDKKGRLLVAAAVGINGDVIGKTQQLLKMGVNVLVLDTAHGHQKKMLNAIKAVRSVSKKVPLAAGNVVTAQATEQLINAGADIVKVGVGPGAMCTTRVMTGVGRPQFSAVLECARVARSLGGSVWADGGIRYPRDVALALAAGASCGMIGTWFAGTYESVGDVLRDNDGRLYKESFGMASKRAVRARNKDQSLFGQVRKEFFEEGISASKLYINPENPGVEDIIDQIVAGVRSAVAYGGAKDLASFYDKAVVGTQSSAGYNEGLPLHTSWS